MKKSLFLVVVFSMLFVVTTQAQLRFGVKGGVNINDVAVKGGDYSSDALTGFQVGATVEWLMIKNFGFDISALYSQKGIKIDEAKIDKNVGYLEIPVNAKLVLGLTEKFKPFATAGPYVSFNLSDSDVGDQWESESFGAGLNFGVGVQLFKYLQIGANYGLSLTDDFKTTSVQDLAKDMTAQSRTWSITAAIYF